MSPYVVLARRWRPQQFSSLVGQGNVAQALKNALVGGRIPHAFLFTGIRGVGKTTLARLLSMCLNCETKITPDPCGTCGSCQEIVGGNHPDVMEIDAASRTKVDQMRELLDLVGYAPTSARYKIFILDEVHMLSTPSFNALLKTLEEPPAHVKFIFATTESRKIPATIVSRCQRYDLKRVTQVDLVHHLTHILKEEQIDSDEVALQMVARAAEGSVRDALSILDQAISHGDGHVVRETVSQLLGLSDREGGLTLLAHLLAGKGEKVLQSSTLFYQSGVEPEALINDLLDMIHQAVRMKVTRADPSQPNDPLIQRLAETCQTASQEHLQMIYQVLLRGRQDLQLAENRHQALEMLLLRVAFLKPVPDLNRLISLAGKGQPPPVSTTGAPPTSPAGGHSVMPPPTTAAPNMPESSMAPDPRTGDRSSTDSRPGTPGSSLAADHPPVPLESPAMADWARFVASVHQVVPELAMKLKQQLACLAFQEQKPTKNGHMVLRLVNDCFGPPDQVEGKLAVFLQEQGFPPYEVTVEPASDQSRPETLGEQEIRYSRQAMTRLNEQVQEHPAVRSLVSRFQAEVLDVKPAPPPTQTRQ